MHRNRLKPTIDLPPVDTPPVPWKAGPDTDWPLEGGRDWPSLMMHPADVRETAPFQPGAVVYVQDGGEARRAVIERVFSERLRVRDYFIPKYRARLLNRDGKAWSGRWRYIFPGDIQRGYIAAGELNEGKLQ